MIHKGKGGKLSMLREDGTETEIAHVTTWQFSTGDALQVSYDHPSDILTIDGIKYAGDLFRNMALSHWVGHVFKIVSNDSGVLTLERLPQHETGESDL